MKIKKVLSAGGIMIRPLRQAPLDKSRGKQGKPKWEVLLSQHSGHHGWSFPKGHVEKGEAPAAAAHREVEEEVGIKGKILDKAGITTYFYYEGKPRFAKASRGKQKILKNVIFFLMRYTGDGVATHACEVENKEWLPLEEVENRLTFETDKKMWADAKEKINNYQ